MISSGMRVSTRSQLGEAGALPTAPVEVVHTRPRKAQIYLTLALGISIYRRKFRTVRKSLGHPEPTCAFRTVRKAVSLSTGRGGERKCGGHRAPSGRGVEAGRRGVEHA